MYTISSILFMPCCKFVSGLFAGWCAHLHDCSQFCPSSMLSYDHSSSLCLLSARPVPLVALPLLSSSHLSLLSPPGEQGVKPCVIIDAPTSMISKCSDIFYFCGFTPCRGGNCCSGLQPLQQLAVPSAFFFS